MDDARHASSGAGGGGPALQVLPSITVLAEADESEIEALEDWARGLDWVHWLFSSVRQRLSHLHLKPEVATAGHHPKLRAATAGQSSASSVFRSHPSPLLAAWENFSHGQVRSALGPLLVQAWQAAQAGDAAALASLDRELSATLPAEQMERSLKAGALLLRSTHRARYQGVLHHYRKSQSDGSTPGHFLIVWAAVAHFFQLSLANVIAEYLRLEWTMAAREFDYANEPDGVHSIAKITSQVMHESGHRLKLMGDSAVVSNEDLNSEPAAARQS